jgi:hypothetical protein
MAEKLPLSKAAEYLLDECRMVLPGIQALFGFQLIAVFNSSFTEKLNRGEQQFHLLAIAMIAIAIAIIMTPAALHRHKGPYEVTESFVRASSRLLVMSMLPLALGISIDFFLICRIIVGAQLAYVLTAALILIFTLLWFVLPRTRAVQRIICGGSH